MQRQLRLGDILDDYCPRERRLTNHAIVAMVGDEVMRTRCTTCDAEHEYKQARVPRPRRKDSPAALQGQVLASAPKRVVPGTTSPEPESFESDDAAGSGPEPAAESAVVAAAPLVPAPSAPEEAGPDSEGPAHRRLIRATLPRQEGQPPASRPAPEFTIRTPAPGRATRFRPRHQRSGGQPVAGNRPGQPGGGNSRGGHARGGNTRSPHAPHTSPQHARRFDGRKRSK